MVLSVFRGVVSVKRGMEAQSEKPGDNEGSQANGETGSGVAILSGAITNGPRGKFVAATGLTAKQKLFCKEYLSNGCNSKLAAKAAGYIHPGNDGCRLMRNPAILGVVRAAREERLAGQMAHLAFDRIKILMTDEAVPPATAFQAAKWVLEAGGFGLAAQTAAAKLVDPADRDLRDFSADELQEFIERQQAALDALRVVSAPSIDVEEVKSLPVNVLDV